MSQIKVNSLVPTGGLDTGAYGGIIQIVPAFTTSQTTATNADFVDVVGLSVTISPSSENSKFLIMASFTVSHEDPNSAIRLNLVRNGVNIAQSTDSDFPCTSILHFGVNTGQAFNYSYQHLDETDVDSGLSDITYKYQIKSTNASDVHVNRRGNGTDLKSTGNLIVCEVSG
jgi:hypothetical protein